MDEWLHILVRRAAQEAVGVRQFKGTLVATGYNPKTHAVKGIVVPHGIESGWVPIATHHAGNNFGVLTGPKAGDPQKLDGDQFDIEFDLGDPNTIVARHRQFSTPDKPPEVQSGEILIMHQDGAKTFYDKDGNLTHSLANGTTVKLKASGDIAVKPKPGQIAYLGGDPADGGTFDFVLTPSGPSSAAKAKL